MAVRINEAGQHSPAAQIDEAGFRTTQRLHVGQGAHTDDDAPSHGHGFSLRLCGIHRQDGSIAVNRIRNLRNRACAFSYCHNDPPCGKGYRGVLSWNHSTDGSSPGQSGLHLRKEE